MLSKKFSAMAMSLMAVCLILPACATPSPEVIEKIVTEEVEKVITQVVKETVKETVIVEGTPQVVEKEVTKVVEVEDIAVTEGSKSVVRFPLGELTDIDPGLLPTTTDSDVKRKLFEGLVDYLPDGTELLLGAESYEANETGDVYTFHLRKEAMWSDGQPITAQDYVWAWRRVVTPGIVSYAGAVYIIKNAQPINEGQMDPKELGVEAVDDYTLKVTLESPAGFFTRLVTMPTLYPVRQDVVEKYGAEWVLPENIVCNGRYILKEWQKDVQLVFERNPYYWGEPAKIAKLVYMRMEDPASTAPAMFETGELDMSPFLPEEYARIKADPELSDQVRIVEQSSVYWVVFDHTVPPFDDVRVRQAFSLAIDRDRIANGIFQGLLLPAYIIPAPGIAGRDESASLCSGDYEKDVEKARALLAEAGYPNGEGLREIELRYRTTFEPQKLGEALPAMWETALGAKIKPFPMERGAFRQWFRSRKPKDEHFDLIIHGWSSDYEDPFNWFNSIFESASDLYHTQWVNAEYDALVAKAAGEPDREKRIQMYMEADKMLEHDLPVASVFHGGTPYLVKPWIKGPIFSRMGVYDLQWGWVVDH